MKKIISIVLTFIMILALAVPALAATNEPTQNQNAKAGAHSESGPKLTTVYFDTDGGVLDKESMTVVNYEEKNTIQLPIAAKDGYIFNGWYYNGKKISGTYFTFKESKVTVVAHWATIESQKGNLTNQLKQLGFSPADISKIFDMFANRNQTVGSVLASEPVWGVVIAALMLGCLAGGVAIGRKQKPVTKEEEQK